MGKEEMEEETYSLIFKSLKHPIRRRILRMLVNKQLTFTEILDTLQVDSGHLSYHMENLGELIKHSLDGKYELSSIGKAAVDLMGGVEERPQPISHAERLKEKNVRMVLLGGLLITTIVLAMLSVNYYGLSQALTKNVQSAMASTAQGFDLCLVYATVILKSEPNTGNIFDLIDYFTYYMTSSTDYMRVLRSLLPSSYGESLVVVEDLLWNITVGGAGGVSDTFGIIASRTNVSTVIAAFKELDFVASDKISQMGHEVAEAFSSLSIDSSRIENIVSIANGLKTTLDEWIVKYSQASGTIYIRADGSVEGTTSIRTDDNVTYVFTADIISNSIVVERNDIIIDGNGYALQGVGNGRGIDLSGRTNVTVHNATIRAFSNGIYLGYYSGNNVISGNNITESSANGVQLYYSFGNNVISENNITANSGDGIGFGYSSTNVISGNNIANNGGGIGLGHSSSNTVSGNNVTNNDIGIIFYFSSNNIMYHNNFVGNSQQAWSNNASVNVCDDGYPSGGNYWSDYGGVDLMSGPFQNETGSDGIGDTPYIINGNNVDYFPLMRPYVAVHDIESVSANLKTSILGFRMLIFRWWTLTCQIS
jgi:parallel beta-helix repeat protein